MVPVTRIGVLTGGGDAPGLNAVIRAVVKSAYNSGIECVGIEDSFDGLLEPGRSRVLTPRDVRGIMRLGGTILGTINRGNPFGKFVQTSEGARTYSDRCVEMFHKMGLQALVVRPGTGGGGGGSVALQAVGHRFELVPLADPGSLSSGDTLGVAVRFENRSMAGLTVNAGYEGQPDSTHAFTAVSDSAGRVRVPISRAGLWYVRTIHMREVHDPPYQWESFWASLTFTAR